MSRSGLLSAASGGLPFRPARALRLPGGQRIRGANLAPKPSQAGSWISLYSQWDFANIKQQLDTIRLAGGNCARLIGSPGGVIGGDFSRDTYLARYEQYIDYARSIGLAVYAQFGAWDGFNVHGLDVTNAGVASQIADEMAAFAKMCDRKPNVIAIDCWSEGLLSSLRPAGETDAQSHTRIAAYVAAARTVTNLPLSYGHPFPQVSTNPFVDTTNATAALAVCDFLDIHLFNAYATAILPADAGPLAATLAGRSILIGEFGIPQSVAQATRTAGFNAVSRAMQNPQYAGALVWNISDQDTVNTNQYGLYDTSFAPRATDVASFKGWPLDSQALSIGWYRSADVVLTQSATTAVPFNALTHDTGLYGVAATPVVTIPAGQGGMWTVGLQMMFGGVAAGGFEIFVARNGTGSGNAIMRLRDNYNASADKTVCMVQDHELNDGDTLQAMYFTAQPSVTMRGVDGTFSKFWARRIGNLASPIR
jgi:hypothetical protein